MELALRLRACPDVEVLDRDAAVGAANRDERLALRVGGADADLAPARWNLGELLLKGSCLGTLLGEIGEVTGVVEAIVPPTPSLKFGTTAFRFAVIEHAVACTRESDRFNAGLWGEPMAITNGMFELDAVLGRREGSEVTAAPELTDPSRDRICNGSGNAESSLGLRRLLSGCLVVVPENAKSNVASGLRAIG